MRLATAVLFPALLLAAAAAPAQVRGNAIEAELDRAHAAMIVDPKQVLTLIDQARVRLDRLEGGEIARARAGWLESEALGRLGETAKAERIATAALLLVERLAPGSKLHGDILMTQGGLALDANRMQRAFELFRRAHAIFVAHGETRAQAIALQNIGTIYSNAGDQRKVLRYYAQAAEVHRGDAGLSQTAANNLGNAYKELGQFDRAEAEYSRALVLSREVGSPLLEARVLNNLASVELQRGKLAQADRFADRGLRLARSNDAAEWTPFLWGVKAQVALKRGNVTAARALFDKTFAGETLEKTSFYFRDFHQSASEAYRAAGDQATAFRHLLAFKRLDDEARAIQSSTNAALAAAQFDYSNQELRITKLREAELRARARQQALGLAGVLVLLAVTLAAFFGVRRSRNETRVANRQLETSNTALDKALKAKSEFLATTSHEIRTPLNGILGMTQVLLSRRGLAPEVTEPLRLIDSAGNTMKAIVDDILDMSQIEHGQVAIDRTELALGRLVDESAGLWRAAAERKGVALIVDMAEPALRIVEDERKLRQMTFNLLSNAVKFTAAGTVNLTVRTTEEQLLIAVRDSGIGIAPDQLDLIFEPFRQADGGTTRQFSGTGLGLAISQKLAEALGGGITVTSEVGRGSCFTLTLPLRRAATPAPVATDGTRARRLADATVIVMEANPLFASMIEACLGDAAAVLTCDADGESGENMPASGDVVLVSDDVDAQQVASLRVRFPKALLVAFGEPRDGLDAAITRRMPPLHLAPALDTLLVGEDAASDVRAAA